MKALEAAEAAKRLVEKKENERKMKKEALKLERTKLVQEKLKQLELQKKIKEEERKKKEADMAARKRQREEDEKKEKERKRKRVVEGRKQQQQEKEEKLQAKKEADMLMVPSVLFSLCLNIRNRINFWCLLQDERKKLTKLSVDESWRNNKRVKEGKENLDKMLKTESKANVVSTRDGRDLSTAIQVCEPSADGRNKSKVTYLLEFDLAEL